MPRKKKSNGREQDTLNTIKLFVASDDRVFLDGFEISKGDICKQIKGFLLQKKGLYFANEKNTKYQLYLEVYNVIKDCVQLFRNEKSKEIYDKPFDSISEDEKSFIEEQVPLRIIETKPK